MMYDPSDLPCALRSPDPQEVGQEPRTEEFGKSGYTEAVIERMATLVAEMASNDGAAFVLEYKEQARAIMAAMKPVDVDLIEAREICAMTADEFAGGVNATGKMYRGGMLDNARPMVRALAALRSRQLERMKP